MDIKSLPIDRLNLSTRSYNILRRNGISTIAELALLSEEDIFSIKNLGQKSAQEILNKLNDFLLGKDEGSAKKCEAENTEIQPLCNLSDEIKTEIRNDLDMRNIKTADLTVLPPRVYNRLMINGYFDMSQIAFMDTDSIMSIPGIDKDAAELIEKSCREYLENDEEICRIIEREKSLSERKKAENDLMIMRTEQKYKSSFHSFCAANDWNIKELDIPPRAKNILMKNGYRKLSEIITLSENDLLNIKGWTTDSISKVMKAISDYLNKRSGRITAFCNGDNTALWDNEILSDMVLRLYENEPFYGYNFNEIVSKLNVPDEVADSRLKRVIGRMITDKKLEYVDYRCYRVYPKLIDHIESTSEIDEKQKNILIKKMNGVTLEAIGNEYGLTRERVRQLLLKSIRSIYGECRRSYGVNVFNEDYYRYFFETYKVEKADLEKWFGITPGTVTYFELTDSKHGKVSLHKALEDMELSAGMRLKVKKYINRNKIYVDGMYIEKRIADLEEFVIKKYCTDDVSFSDFVNIYNDFLSKMEIPKYEKLYYTDEMMRTRKNRLTDAHFLLWKYNEQMRYYDIDGKDYTELIDVLDLGGYKNIELSTSKFMDMYPEIMVKYDIRDQYELHNLLRKIIPDGKYPELTFGRMPELKFGTFDRTAALIDLLIDNSPISIEDFAELVHKEFGYEQSTAIMTYFQPLAQYYHEGIYSVNFNDIPSDRKVWLKAALTNDFYFISEIRNIYMEMYPDADMEQINPRTLKSMGFVVLSRYAVQNYSSLDAYYEAMFTKEDIVDVSLYKGKHSTIQMFYQKLYNLKCSLDVIEFENDKIINIRRLEAMGITKDDLKAFCGRVYDFAEDNTYFTIQSIRQAGFDDELFELGFGDLFYANLILSDKKISSCKMMGNIILYKGDIKITFRGFVTDIIRQHGSIDIIVLENELRDKYGCEFDRWDLTFKTKGTEVYYDDILKRFYATEDMYYNELEETEEF